MHAYHAAGRRLAVRSTAMLRATSSVQAVRGAIGKPAGYYRVDGIAATRAYTSHTSRINGGPLLSSSTTDSPPHPDSTKPCADDAGLNVDNKSLPELALPSASVFAPSRSNGRRRRRYRILSYGGNDSNNNNSNNNGGNGSSATGQASSTWNGTASQLQHKHLASDDKHYMQLAVSISDQTLRRCLVKRSDHRATTATTDVHMHPASKAFCKELALALKAALRPRIDPTSYAPAMAKGAGNEASAWYAVRDHIALRPSTQHATPLLMETVQEVARELDVDVCRLDAWIMQELFDPLLPSSDELWPVYPRRAHDDTLAAMDDAFVEADVDEYDAEVEEDEEAELDEEDEGVGGEEGEEDELPGMSSATGGVAKHPSHAAYHSPYLPKELSSYSVRPFDGSMPAMLMGRQPPTIGTELLVRLARKPSVRQPTLEDKMAATFHRLFAKLTARSDLASPTRTPLLVHVTDAIDLGRTRIGQVALYALLRAIHHVRQEGGQVALVASCNDSLVFPADYDLSATFNGGAGVWDAFVPMRVPSVSSTMPIVESEGGGSDGGGGGSSEAEDVTATLDKKVTLELAHIMAKSRWTAQQQQRIADINLHNMKRMLRQRNVLSALSDNKEAIPELADELWCYDRVARVINTAVGLAEQLRDADATISDKLLVTSKEIAEAAAIVKGNASYLAMPAEEQQQQQLAKEAEEEHGAGTGHKSWQMLAMERHTQQLQRANFNVYERRLTNCLVNPGK
ncbi:hypothetical protein SYNPS1DRAFT_29698 [Syncephalis pseudoplumigaleata]|uniref:DUF7608 domain-containing protein n=1 Tax=Syncephalis pseudoplumigaleata TaxID=1712513 RepID=A0A4P9YZR7_9FUNG|nr:hypothetical protein SYNPS1DRAFT_29698 [Syncephalis pseudoplumigaleata]|eukprot:RKP24540.1 hypothetical protein SYNPS1DRAFT_29698 [Syncephalis pseudoplumigaleata]